MAIFCLESKKISDYDIELSSISGSLKVFRNLDRDITGYHGLRDQNISKQVIDLSEKIMAMKTCLILDIEIIKNTSCCGFKISTKNCFHLISTALTVVTGSIGGSMAVFVDEHTVQGGLQIKLAGGALIAFCLVLSTFNAYISRKIRDLQRRENELTRILALCNEIKSSLDPLNAIYEETKKKDEVDSRNSISSTDEPSSSQRLNHKESIIRRWNEAARKLLQIEKDPIIIRCTPPDSRNNSETSDTMI